MAVRHGNSDARGGNLDRLITDDLTGFVDHLHFFARVALFLRPTDLWNRIEGDRMLESGVLVVSAREVRASPFDQIRCSLQSRSTDRLISADDDSLHFRGVMKWLQCDDHLRRRTVWTGDDPASCGQLSQRVLRIDFGNDQRNLGVHAEIARFIDDQAA